MKPRAHLFATDVSVLDLHLGAVEAVAIIVPENRLASAKVAVLRERATLPVHVQPRGKAVEGLPPADVAVSWMYSQVFPIAMVDAYPLGVLNMHGGRIPEYRGASVLQWAIINGESELWVTWHRIVEAVDAGPILVETSIPIGWTDDAHAVRARMIAAGTATSGVALERLVTGAAPVRVPDVSFGRVWPQRRPVDGAFGPGLPLQTVANLLRALPAPWPPATFVCGDQRIAVRSIAPAAGPDTVSYPTTDHGVIALTRDGSGL